MIGTTFLSLNTIKNNAILKICRQDVGRCDKWKERTAKCGLFSLKNFKKFIKSVDIS